MRLMSYLGLIGFYHLSFAGFLWALRKRHHPLPERFDLRDMAVLALATQKLSRTITKERITTPLRRPFTETPHDAADPARETPRGEGLRRTIGELLTCPFCTGTWVAASLSYGLVLAPRHTRLIASIFAIDGVSDFVHLGFLGAKQRV